jgi:hypothetical protein
VDPVRLGVDSQVGNAVPCRVVAVVVVVRLRIYSFRRACDLEGVVDHKSSVMLLSWRGCLTIPTMTIPTMSSSFLSPVTRELKMKSKWAWLLEGAVEGKGEVLGQNS